MGATAIGEFLPRNNTEERTDYSRSVNADDNDVLGILHLPSFVISLAPHSAVSHSRTIFEGEYDKARDDAEKREIPSHDAAQNHTSLLGKEGGRRGILLKSEENHQYEGKFR